MAPLSILLIEADANLRNSLAIILQKAGYPTTSVARVCDAVNSFSELHYDLVIFDIDILETNELSLFPILQGLNPKLLVFILSEYPTQDQNETAKYHWCDFFVKPINPELLLSRIQNQFALDSN
jgi:DNA-binding NtrC family response regulator